MEILEKLPGITVERHLLMHGSYTLASGSERPRVLHCSQSSRSHREFKTGYTAVDRRKSHSNEFQSRRSKLDHKPFREKYTVSQYRKFLDKPDIDLELEVLGKNPQHLLQEIVAKREAASNISTPNDTPQAPPVLKSILKRTGSGVSTRSCSLLEVMSVDSGMSRLAASLAAHKQAQNNGFKRLSKSSHVRHSPSASLDGFKVTKSAKTEQASQVSNSESSQKVSAKPMQTSGTAVSPSKSVSFKLDPEMQRRERERSKTQNKRGEARWGVVITPCQSKNPKERTRTSGRVDFTTRKKEFRNFDNKIFDHKRNDEIKEENIGGISGNQHATLVRHHASKTRTSLSDIQNLSEPYRKLLMNRALEQTQRFSKDNLSQTNTITLRSYLASVASSQSDEVQKTNKNSSSLDKQYMSLPSAVGLPASSTQQTSLLPALQLQQKQV